MALGQSASFWARRCELTRRYFESHQLNDRRFDLILTEDPAEWPWHAWLNLPLIPLSLIMSRTTLLRGTVSPIVPLFLAWPTTLPVRTKRIDPQTWLRTQRSASPVYPFPSLISWPPAPIVATIFLPLIQNVYRNLFSRLHHWVLNSEPSLEPPAPIFPWRLEIRFGQDAENGGANEEAREEGNRANQQHNQEGDDNQDPVAAAERVQSISSASVGRFVGGALLIPRISNLMGSLLFRLSKRSDLLRKLLAIRPPLKERLDGFSTGEVTSVSDLGRAAKDAFRVLVGGTRSWAEADPVW